MKKNTYIKIGLIVTFCIVVLIWGINFLKGVDVFKKEASYKVIYERVDGLQVSNPVLINGYKVGQVTAINFMSDGSGKLVVTFSIGSEFVLPKPTTARIFSSDLMGTKSIDLIFEPSEKLQIPGDTLVADFEGSLQEMVSLQMLPLKKNAEDLMKEMEEAIAMITYIFNEDNPDNILNTFSSIKRTFNTLENSASNIDTIMSDGVSKIDNILGNVESITNNFKDNNKEITNLINNLSNISDSLASANIVNVTNALEQNLVELSAILVKINEGTGSMGKLVNNDTLYYNLEDVTYNLNKLLEDLRVNPKRYVHFSAVDFGKTIYVDDKSRKLPKNQRSYYTILLQKSNKPVELNPDNFKGLDKVEEHIFNNTYVYTVGRKTKLVKAEKSLKSILEQYPEAEIIEISESEYKTIN